MLVIGTMTCSKKRIQFKARVQNHTNNYINLGQPTSVAPGQDCSDAV